MTSVQTGKRPGITLNRTPTLPCLGTDGSLLWGWSLSGCTPRDGVGGGTKPRAV